MRRIQRVGNFNGELKHLVQRQRLARNAVLQCLTVQEFHDDESLSVLLVNLVDGANVRVIQGRCGLRFAPKAFERDRVLGRFGREKLESDQTLQARVFRLIDDTHPPATELLDDAVMRDGLTDHGEGPTLDSHVRGAENASQRFRGRSRRLAWLDAQTRYS